MKCKCGARLHKCPDCDGQTQTTGWGSKLTCSSCRSTGLLCGQHGGHWK